MLFMDPFSCQEIVQSCGNVVVEPIAGRYPLIKGEIKRYILALEYLTKLHDHDNDASAQGFERRVIITDLRDVMFQADPFESSPFTLNNGREGWELDAVFMSNEGFFDRTNLDITFHNDMTGFIFHNYGYH